MCSFALEKTITDVPIDLMAMISFDFWGGSLLKAVLRRTLTPSQRRLGSPRKHRNTPDESPLYSIG